jgi:coproporphyrinogen III oxidase
MMLLLLMVASLPPTNLLQVSAPPLIAWKYNVVPEAGSEEDKLMQVLRTPREWV